MSRVEGIIINFMLLLVLQSYSQTNHCNYREFLAQNNRTYWVETRSTRIPWRKVRGMFFDIDGNFDQYYIEEYLEVEENDTIFTSPLMDFSGCFCTKYFIHRDTIFINDWYATQTDTAILLRPTAYKILYATKQRLLLLPLNEDDLGTWRDEIQHYPRCNILNVIEFKKVK